MRFRIVASSTNHASCSAHAIIGNGVVSSLHAQVSISSNFKIDRFHSSAQGGERIRPIGLINGPMINRYASSKMATSSFAGTNNDQIAVMYDFCVNDRGPSSFQRATSGFYYWLNDYDAAEQLAIALA